LLGLEFPCREAKKWLEPLYCEQPIGEHVKKLAVVVRVSGPRWTYY
jgi:hypothetical protein